MTAEAPAPSSSRPSPYTPTSNVRFVTAAALFDGHDAAINIMRRILQDTGVEVIHLGHNRSVAEVVETAIQEDAHGIAISSYQGGHMEYFRYAVELLRARGAGHIKVFGGGGGVIVPAEIAELEAGGVTKIFSPEDGRTLGLQGMIDQMVAACDYPMAEHPLPDPSAVTAANAKAVARVITAIEAGVATDWRQALTTAQSPRRAPVLGITGTGGAGKSSLTDELVRRLLRDFPDRRVAILSVDPSKRKTGGALLGDRIRMNAIYDARVYMRSLATRAAHVATSGALAEAIAVTRAIGFDLVIVETAGIGQSDSAIIDLVDVSLYVMTSEFGAASQLEKIDMLDFADVVAINKFDKRGAEDALRDVKKQYQRNHKRFSEPADAMPVFGTVASQFNDAGTNWLYVNLLDVLARKTGEAWHPDIEVTDRDSRRQAIIPPERERYLAEIADAVQAHKTDARQQAARASEAYAFAAVLQALGDPVPPQAQLYAPDSLSDAKLEPAVRLLRQRYQAALLDLDRDHLALLQAWPDRARAHRAPIHTYEVRGKTIQVENTTRTLSGLEIPKVAVPDYRDWGDLLAWLLLENVPGQYPFTAGVFEYKRQGEDPTRQFAGEGTPERTNKRFHYLSAGQPAIRLSTAFDSVTLYGEDPATPPDVLGKIGNSGVSICTLDDAKKLYSGFDLCAPSTSVSMTINGPAPVILAFFLNTAIDQQVEAHLLQTNQWEQAEGRIQAYFREKGLAAPVYRGSDRPEGDRLFGLRTLGVTGDMLVSPEVYQDIKARTLSNVRGTVQADILKEDQAQNTCIFSTEFALRMMGDVQQYFIDHAVKNYYSVSISGYHIAEAGANPISQLAFTLANGFTYVEYYLKRGMAIDDFAPNLSFFFSNGIDPEYAVIGRVARRIWSTAMKRRYGANERSQKLKYHIQTSGRSLHAQEIDFNDIRTTLQALYAIYDNCNSLHTNAYDEAITTPTEASVRRAMAIQLIINRELGLAKNENPLQGAFVIQELTELVEEAVLLEFRRLSQRGGVLGAMETMYQRGKIQDESMHYEHLKHTGELPIIGVNTFLNPQPVSYGDRIELIRSTDEEKQQQIDNLAAFQARNDERASQALQQLQAVSVSGGNLFEALMETVKTCSLGQITRALYAVGGQYRRNM
ncbi:MAG: methylmalonyl-CoA mutase family protein [Candidatus Sericytochromatia bacterium]|nr:methylmalonyl-CoA mutase family protein [Candidatus Sericytochromatia bacterium]